MIMETFCMLKSRSGATVTVGYDFKCLVGDLARGRLVDAYLVATEDGFSPLGIAKDFLAEDTGISRDQIRRMADWNRFDNGGVTLVAYKSQRLGSLLKGFILCPCENSLCYEQFAVPRFGNPHRDFYYNVIYEAIAYACRAWGAGKLAISHLSARGNFHEDIVTCTAEALAHFCDDPDNPTPRSFIFTGCCIELGHLAGIRRLNAEGKMTRHIPIKLTAEPRGEAHLIHLAWDKPSEP